MRNIFFLIVLSSTQLFGQFGSSQSLNPHLDIRPFMSLEVTLGGQDLNYEFQDIRDMERGILKHNVFRVRIKTNQNWQLGISTLSPNLISLANGQMSGIPASVLEMRKENQGAFIPLSTTQQTIATGSRGGSQKPSNHFALDLLADVGLNNPSGVYIIDVVFTLTAD